MKQTSQYQAMKQEGILLNANESSVNLSLAIREEIAQAIQETAFNRYPQDDYTACLLYTSIRHRLTFVNYIKKALKFLICIDMRIISYPFFCDSPGWNICRNTYIVEISAENTHATAAACLIRNGFISPFSAP